MTQGDPLAMSMYICFWHPSTHPTNNKSVKPWYADFATAVGKVSDLRAWWDELVSNGQLTLCML